MSEQMSLFPEPEAPVEKLKCISLWQPWATAIALGLKKIETRSWSTDYRGPLLIHAAKKWTSDIREIHEGLRAKFSLPENPPRGQAICIVDLVDCRAMDLEWMKEQSETEYVFGDWSPGRYGWVLKNPRVFRKGEDVFMKGHQGFWSISADEFMKKLLCDCCDRPEEYNGYPEYPRLFKCPKNCYCHD